MWSAVGEVGRGGGERRGGRKRVEVEGRGGGGEEGREGKGRRRSRGRKRRGDLRRWEEGGSIQLQAAGGKNDTTGQRSRNFSSSLSHREREWEGDLTAATFSNIESRTTKKQKNSDC